MTSPSDPKKDPEVGMYKRDTGRFLSSDLINQMEEMYKMTQPRCPDFDFSEMTFPLPEPLASYLVSATKEAIPALFTSQASVAVSHLIRVAYSLSIEGSTVRERSKKVVEDLKASASESKPSELEVGATSDSQHCGPLLDALTEENLLHHVFGIINTLSLLVKMDEPAFKNYAERRFKSVAGANGLSALTNLFPPSLTTRTISSLKHVLNRRSETREQIYLLYLVQLDAPSTRKSAEAFGASRLTCHKMILPSLFVQTCDSLNWRPGKLLKALDYGPFGRGSKRVNEFLKVLNGKKTLVGRYSILLAGILPYNIKYSSSCLTVKQNPSIIEMLKRINIRCGNDSVSRIKGTKQALPIDSEHVEMIVARRERGVKKEITLFSSYEL